MDLQINVREVMANPAFASPLRLGIFIHLASFTSPESLHVSIKPSALAERLAATKIQVETAITKLAEHDAINLEKSTVTRGVWEIDMSPLSYLFTGEWSAPVPDDVPIKKLMEAWDSAYKITTGKKNMRMTGTFWSEKRDWITLYDELGQSLFTAVERYFDDQRYAKYGYSFKVFFKTASELTEEKVNTGWRYA
jgi:hypothetical protein